MREEFLTPFSSSSSPFSPQLTSAIVLLILQHASWTPVSCKPHFHFSINGLDVDHQAGTTPNLYEIPYDLSGFGSGNLSHSRPAPYPLGNMDNAEMGVGPGVNGPSSKGGLKHGGQQPGNDPGIAHGSGKDKKSKLSMMKMMWLMS